MSAMAAGARPQRRTVAPGVPSARRVALRLVERLPRRHRLGLSIVSATMVVASLLLVVIGHSMLAAGQVRLANVQSALATEQARHYQEITAVATLENPTRIVTDARQQLHMVSAGQVQQLPYVPLSKPLPPPHVAP